MELRKPLDDLRVPLLIVVAAVLVVGAIVTMSKFRPMGVVTPTVADDDRVVERAPAQDYRAPENATLRVYLRPFNDTSGSLQQIRELSALLPRQQLIADAGLPAFEVLRQEMSLSADTLPRTQALLAATASGESPDEVLARVPGSGRIYFPALPLVPDSAPNGRRVGSSRFVVSDPGGSAMFNELIARSARESESLGLDGHVIDFDIPIASLRRPEVQALLTRQDVSVVQLPLKLKYGAAQPCQLPPGPLLTPDEENAIRAQLATATRDVDVFVLDSGWPETAYDSSRQRLFEIFDEVRSLYGLPAAPRAAPLYEPAGFDHADKIQDALEPFTSLDTARRVRVTYVPLSLAQNARDVLHEMMMLGQLIRTRAHLLGGRHGPASPSEIYAATMFADAHVSTLPPVPGLVMYTNKAVLDALNEVVADAARTRDRYYVANYSFVVEAGMIAFSPPTVQRGLGVVAAGNDGVDVTTALVDLARRGGEDIHFLTVMNLDRQGALACGSSYLNAEVLDDAHAVGFSGQLGTESQTSFAAPRVAWLLAAAEASRTAVQPPNLWFHRLQRRLHGARPPGASGYGALAIDSVRLGRIWH